MSHTNPLARYPAVPRYTSYPTAPHFYLLPAGTRQQWLAEVPRNAAVSLYIHLPYCAQQCWYCGCHTRISRRYEPVIRYLDQLCTEIKLVAAALGQRQKVGHIHWGGGSPSLLRATDFAVLMQHLAESFLIEPQSEIAIELDPRNTTEAKMAAYALGGVNRISIGVQDFSPAVQQAINRHQPFHTVYETVQLADTYGMHHLSFDLVYGLPSQTLEGFKETLEHVVLLKPNRIALFGYAHVPWMKKAMRLIDATTLPNAGLRCAMVTHATDYLAAAGYVAIGLDHYALPHDSLAQAAQNHTLRRNFQGYGTDPLDILIGLGASAISHLPQGYVQNPPLIEAYTQMLQSNTLPQQKGFALSVQDRLRKQVIEALMCNLTVSLDDCCHAAGLPAESLDDCLPALQPLEQDGLIRINGRQIDVSPQLPQAVRLACVAFDAYYKPQPDKHAQVA